MIKFNPFTGTFDFVEPQEVGNVNTIDTSLTLLEGRQLIAMESLIIGDGAELIIEGDVFIES